MYAAFTLIVFFCAMVIQTSVLHFFTIGGVKPDLILIIVVYLGLMKGSDVGCVSGFLFGLVEDAYSGMYFGTNALAKTVLGFLCGMTGKRLYTQSLFAHMLCVVIGTGIHAMIILSVHGFGAHWQKLLLYEILYNMICCPWIVFLFRFGEQRLHVKSSS